MTLLTDPKVIKVFPEGQHKGTIKGVQKTDRGGFEYIEFTIDVPEQKMIIKHSISFNVSSDESGNPKSQLAKFLKALGFDVSLPVDIESVVEKKISFMSKNKIVGDASYPRIINDTVMLDTGM